MIEQWMNAEDNDILDAWENGGKYKGKKVTDKDILAHYRKRRNSYDRDDPEWDQWNQDLFQVRFRISNEKVMMRYAQGKISPTAVAAHYRQWAKKMPKNSSYYRSLMATAGDYAKAARSASQSGSKAFDYDALMRRHNNIQRDIDRGQRVISALDILAQNKGLIPEGATLTDPGVLSSFEARELDLWLASGSPEDEDWKVIVDSIKKEFPGWNGNLTEGRIERMMDVVIDGKRRQIRNLNGAPYDTSSQKQGLRNDIRGIQNLRDLVEAGGGLDAATAAANSFDVWYGSEDSRVPVSKEMRGEQMGFINSTDPADLLDGNDVFDTNLRRYYKDLTRDGRDQDAAHAEAMRRMLAGDVDWLRNYEGSSNIFGSQFSTPEQLLNFAATIAYVNNGIEMAARGDAVLYFNPDAPSAEQRLLEPGTQSLPFEFRNLKVNPVTGEHSVDHDGQKVIPYQMSDGTWTHAMYEGSPVVSAQGENLGYVWDLNGFTMYGRRNEDGTLSYDDDNPWNEDIGEELTKVEGGGYTVTYSDDRLQQAIEGELGEMVSQADIATDTESYEEYVLAVQGATDLTEEQKVEVIESAGQLDTAGFWEDKTSILTDPANLDAYKRAFPGDFEALERLGWAGTEYEGEVTMAIARESLRRRFNLTDEVPVTDEDMVYLTPLGGIKSNQYGFDREEAVQGAAAAREQRTQFVGDNAALPENKNLTYGQLMAQMRPTLGPSTSSFLDDAFVRGEVATSEAVSPYSAVAEGNSDQFSTLVADGRYEEAIRLFSEQLREGTGSDDIIVELLKSDPNYAQKMNAQGMQLVYTAISINSTDEESAGRSVEALTRMRAFSDFETPAADVLNGGGDYDAVRAGSEFALDRLFTENRERTKREFESATSEGIEGAGWDIDRPAVEPKRTDVFRAYGEMRNIPGVTPLDITKPMLDPITTTGAPRAGDVAPYMATSKEPVVRKDPAIKVSSTISGLTGIGSVGASGAPIKVATGLGSIGSIKPQTSTIGQQGSQSAYTGSNGIYYPQGTSPNVTPK